ncbi:hypothetical protein VTH06DRAFT_2296 [Thermothelomyces fergusii]
MATDLSSSVLSALYQRAHAQDIEYTASGYWQALMQYHFPLREGYAVLCEQSPDDDDRTRIDQIIFHIRPHTRFLVRVCMIEGKRRGAGSAHIVAAEDQARNAARKAIETGTVPRVFALTHWRTHFRVWEYDPEEGILNPRDEGSTEQGDRNSYLEIASEHGAATFNRFVEMIKGFTNAQYGPPPSNNEGAGPSSGPGDVRAEPAGQHPEGYQYEAVWESSAQWPGGI